MLPIIVKPDAADDIREAFDYYEAKQIDLGAEFLDALDYVLGTMGDFPYAYAQVYKHARRAPLNRFPYLVIYTVEDDTIFIHACIHGKRHPRTWQRRVR